MNINFLNWILKKIKENETDVGVPGGAELVSGVGVSVYMWCILCMESRPANLSLLLATAWRGKNNNTSGQYISDVCHLSNEQNNFETRMMEVLFTVVAGTLHNAVVPFTSQQ